MDSAVETGSVVTADYDPMIAKVIAWGEDRESALKGLDAALAETVLLGVDGNIAFLRSLIAAADVRSGSMDTGLIDRLGAFVAPEPAATALAAAAAAVGAARLPARGNAHASPLWLSRSGWRIGSNPEPPVREFETSTGAIVAVPDTASAPVDAVVATAADGTLWVHADGAVTALRPLTRRAAAALRLHRRERVAGATSPELRAPMPGTVVAIHVPDGAAVQAGDRIVTIEAMKMEHATIAPHAGIVSLSIHVGDQVSRDQLLARVVAAVVDTPDDSPSPQPEDTHG